MRVRSFKCGISQKFPVQIVKLGIPVFQSYRIRLGGAEISRAKRLYRLFFMATLVPMRLKSFRDLYTGTVFTGFHAFRRKAGH